MGLFIATAKVMLDEAKERPFHGSILQLGLQDLTFTENQFLKFARDRGFDVKSDRTTQVRRSREQNNHSRYIPNSTFFTYLGFSEIHSLDCSDYEGSNIVFDLNNSGLPNHLHERYDFILDAGTLEHIFNTPQALSNIIAMCKVGGRIMHISPSSNQVNHGFYSFSPTLFVDFYDSNRFTVHTLYLAKVSASGRALHGLDLKKSRQFVTETVRLNSRIYYTICIVEKVHRATQIITPQQSAFRTLWLQHSEARRQNHPAKLKDFVISVLHKIGLFDLGKHIWIKYRTTMVQLRLRKLS